MVEKVSLYFGVVELVIEGIIVDQLVTEIREGVDVDVDEVRVLPMANLIVVDNVKNRGVLVIEHSFVTDINKAVAVIVIKNFGEATARTVGIKVLLEVQVKEIVNSVVVITIHHLVFGKGFVVMLEIPVRNGIAIVDFIVVVLGNDVHVDYF